MQQGVQRIPVEIAKGARSDIGRGVAAARETSAGG
jgi:hypothetical protein